MRIQFGWVFASVLLLGSGHAARAQGSAGRVASQPLISTGVTGRIEASGLDDPQYVLSVVPVQRLMLEATQHPLSKADIQKAVEGTPVTLDQLLRLELLRREEETYRLNYLLLTIDDQK